MAYTPDWEPLEDALKRVMAIGATEDQAKKDLCLAVADKKIRVRAKIAASDPELGGGVFSGDWVRVPAHLRPVDFDWVGSRPFLPWVVGPPVGPLSYSAPYLSPERRPIDLIEVATADAQKLFRSSQSRSEHGATGDDEKLATVELPKDGTAARNNGPKKRNAGRKSRFAASIRRAVFKLMDHHGDLSADDPVWTAQADVERAVRAELSDDGPPAISTVRSHVSASIAEWRRLKTTERR